MSKFFFRLEPVLGMRSLQEELAQQELATAKKRWRACADRLAETRRLLGETLEEQAGDGLDLAAGLYLDCYREYLGKRGAEEELALARCEKEVEKRRANMVEARRARAVLERLKEKRYQDFRTAEKARETKELDDLGTRTHQFYSSRKGGD